MNCTNYDFLRLVVILRNIITIIKIAVPVIILVIGVIDLLKIVTAGTPEAVKEAVKTLTYRFLAGVAIFFLPSIVGAFMNLVSDYSSAKSTYKTCVENSKDLNHYKQLKEEKKTAEKAERERKQSEVDALKKEQVSMIKAAEAIKQKYKQSTTNEGSFIGAKYDLSDADIEFLAKASLCENNFEEAIAIGASQIVNRYELYNNGSESIVDYVKRSQWWQCVNEDTDRGVTEQAKSTVKDVIVLGNRALPPYIDEQDCPSCPCTSNDCRGCSNGYCICSVTTNGTTYTSPSDLINHSIYSRDNSKIKNGWGADYTYFTHACSGDCDIYGYTQGALDKYNRLNGS